MHRVRSSVMCCLRFKIRQFLPVTKSSLKTNWPPPKLQHATLLNDMPCINGIVCYCLTVYIGFGSSVPANENVPKSLFMSCNSQ